MDGILKDNLSLVVFLCLLRSKTFISSLSDVSDVCPSE
jgi:hypothetical protein